MKRLTAQIFSKVIGFRESHSYILKLTFSIIAVLLCYTSTFGQTTIFSEDFESAATPQSNLNTANYIGWSNVNVTGGNNRWWIFDTSRATVPTGSYALSISRNSPYTGGGTKPRYNRNSAATNIAYYTTQIDASNYNTLTLDFNWIGRGEVGYDYGFAVYSTDGVNWFSFTNVIYLENQNTVQNVINLDISELDGQQFYLGFYWTNDNSGGSQPSLTIDDIAVKGTLTSSYCAPSTDSEDVTYIDNVSFVGTLNDVSTLNSSYGSNDGYQDWSANPKSIQAQGEGVNILAEAGGVRGAWKAWVDWNQNNQFEVSEEVYNPGNSLGTTTEFGFIIPDSQTPGDYRIRIRVGINYWDWDNSGVFESDEEFYYDFDSCENFINTTFFGLPDYYFGEAEDYLFTVIEKCDSYVDSVTDGEACGTNETVDLSFTGVGGTTVTGFNIYASETGGSPLTPSPSIVGSTGSWTTPTISTTTTYWVTATSACSNGESLVRVPVTAHISSVPTITFTPSTPIVCGEDNIVEIAATGDEETLSLIDEDFESGLGVFSNINNDSNTASVNNITQWQVEISSHNSFSGDIWSPVISSGSNNNQFALATSDHINSGSTTAKSVDNSLTLTNSINTTNFTSLDLSFDVFYQRYFSDGYTNPSYEEFIEIDVSDDNGSNWITIEKIEEDLGYGSKFKSKSYDLAALGYLDITQLKIRIRHFSYADDSSGLAWLPDGVAIDNVKLIGKRPKNTAFDWNITTEAYSDSGATVPYIQGVSTPVSTIYVKPTPTELQSGTSFTFNATAIFDNGCNASTDITITNNTRYLKNPTPDRDWDDSNNWLPGSVPTGDNCVIIPDDCKVPNNAGMPPVGYNAFAKNLTIKGSGNLEILSDNNLTVTDWIKIESGGVLDVKSGANLIQVADVPINENSGEMTMDREVLGVSSTDYVFWASPVNQFYVGNISSASTSEYIYEWIPTVGNNYGNWQVASGNMSLGKGYAIRGLETIAPLHTARFTGIPNNGLITNVPISRGTYGINPGENGYINPTNDVFVTPEDDNWNLIGNPYPSSISANKFINDNTNIDGTIYLWTHASEPNDSYGDPFYDDYQYNYNPNDYIEHNNSGSNPPGTNDLYIASGQAFFVLMLDSAPQNDNVTFSNTMRNANYRNDNFYEPNQGEFEKNSVDTEIERHRIWLDLITPNEVANTILVGYIEGATDGIDRLFDGYEFAGSSLSFYSLNNTDKLSIQGKALPFNNEDLVNLGCVIPNEGIYKIAINTLDGIFENTVQGVYLEDTYTNSIHDLRNSPYSFTSQSGTFNDRFILRYTSDNTLGIDTFNNSSDIQVLAFNQSLKVTSETKIIKTITIHDIQGRLVSSINSIGKHLYQENNLSFSLGAYLVNVHLSDGTTFIKKVVF